MTADVERVAAIFCLSHGSGLCPRRCDACIDDARAAMAATLELTAEALRWEAQEWENMGGSLQANKYDRVADWLQQRAIDVKETGRG